MFDWVDSEREPIDQAYAARRAYHEPLVEIVQNKGQSEAHPTLALYDEFASFEVLDFAEYLRREAAVGAAPGGSYVRDGLGRGLALAQRTGGVNPYKYGFVGGSDFHNGLSDSAEGSYAGTLGAADSARTDLQEYVKRAPTGFREETLRFLYKSGSGGLTGVWAEQNTRQSIFDALRRKETFATSGTRLKVRFFGGWAFDDTLLERNDWVRAAYQSGVPMGGDLPLHPANEGTSRVAPTFIVWALKDPDGANLDRLQVVKVWLENGKRRERIYDVALAGSRKIDPQTGKIPPVGNTVDVHTATYTNAIGAVNLAVVWQDPQFEYGARAFYYVRVLEIPTPRWSAIAAVKAGRLLPEGVPAIVQERGWSSPIWYAPSGDPEKAR